MYKYTTIQTDGYYLQHCKKTKELIENGWELVNTFIDADNKQYAHFKKLNKSE